MNRLVRFFKLPNREKVLFLEALTLVFSMRLILWLVPFRFFRKNFRRILHESANPKTVDWRRVRKITAAVTAASRLVPFATCLTQAMAAFWLIKLNGQSSDLRIGVARNSRMKLKAHAWLEIEGRVVLGKLPEHHGYTVLNSLPAKSL